MQVRGGISAIIIYILWIVTVAKWGVHCFIFTVISIIVGDDGMKKIIVVLLLTIVLAALVSPALADTMQTQKNIVQTASDAGQFKTLVTAIKAAGLTDTLSTGGPYTVFAPNDVAFDKLPAGTVQSLVNDKPKLTNILKYHVVQGKYTASDLAKMDNIKAIDGKTLTIKKQSDGSLMIDGAKVVGADISTSNGVIHAIDSVMIPK